MAAYGENLMATHTPGGTRQRLLIGRGDGPEPGERNLPCSEREHHPGDRVCLRDGAGARVQRHVPLVGDQAAGAVTSAATSERSDGLCVEAGGEGQAGTRVAPTRGRSGLGDDSAARAVGPGR
jgi:hypothetical protein